MTEQLLKQYSSVESLRRSAGNTLKYFYIENSRAFTSKNGEKVPKLLSHALCVLASINLNQNFFTKEEKIAHFKVFFEFSSWTFADSLKRTNKDFDLYLQSVAICAIGELYSRFDAATKETFLKDKKIVSKIRSFFRKTNGNYQSYFNELFENKDYDVAKNHPMFIYWIWKSLRSVKKNLFEFLSRDEQKKFDVEFKSTEKDKFEKTRVKNRNGAQIEKLHSYLLNRIYYYTSMCSAIPNNEEDALKLGYLLHSLMKFDEFTNDVLIEHGMELVFSVLFEGDRVPQIQALYKEPGLRIHASPIELLTLLSQTRVFKNNFHKYLKSYTLCFEWINNTKRERSLSHLWMVEPWRGVDEPEAWLNCININFIEQLYISIRTALRSQLIRKYNGELSRPGVKWVDMKGDFKTQIDELIGSVQDNLKQSKRFDKCSLLLYGPPGTAKTSIAKALAWEMQFDLVIIAPHYFAENGMDGIIKSAREIFDELMVLDKCVVLFDEVDELVSTRDEEYEKISKFITTSMLPWFQDLHDRGEIIFIATTNYIKQFDPAIKRPGRFDYVLPVGPPNKIAIKVLLNGFLRKQFNVELEKDSKRRKKLEKTIQDVGIKILKAINSLRLPQPLQKNDEEKLIVKPIDLFWRPTIGEIKTVCEIVARQDSYDEPRIQQIVNKISSNPLIGVKEWCAFESDKTKFRYPPLFK